MHALRKHVVPYANGQNVSMHTCIVIALEPLEPCMEIVDVPFVTSQWMLIYHHNLPTNNPVCEVGFWRVIVLAG